MRVLHISSYYPPAGRGGAEKVAQLLADRQVAAGWTVAAASLPAGLGEVEPPSDGVRRYTLADAPSTGFLGPDNRRLHKIVRTYAADPTRSIRQAVEDFRPDIVHTHSMVDLPILAWRVAREGGAKLVHTTHDYDLVCANSSLQREGIECTSQHRMCKVLSVAKKRLADRVSAVAYISEAVRARHHRYGWFTDRDPALSPVIWNGVDWGLEGSKAAARQPRPTYVFGFLGRLVEEKGVGLLLRALRAMDQPGWSLRVGGTATPEAQRIWRDAAEGLPVEFLGQVGQDAFYDSIDLLVVPSTWAEPFGLVALEALARGVPVLASNTGGLGELMAYYDPSSTFPNADQPALTRRLRQALSERPSVDRAKRARLAGATSLEQMSAAYEALYARALASAPA